MAIKKSGAEPIKKEKITCEVLEKCGVISDNGKGYTLELRYVSWNGAKPKYDIRIWKDNGDGTEKSYKGMSITGEELEALGDIIKGMEE